MRHKIKGKRQKTLDVLFKILELKYIIQIITTIVCGSFFLNCSIAHAQDNQKIYHWIQQLGGPGWDLPNGIATDSKNNVYIAGGFTEVLQGSKKSIQSEGNRDVYVARFTDKGKLQWLWQAGGLYMDKITCIKAAPDNDLYIAGILQGEIKFGKQKITGESKKLFVARINKRGKSEWIQTFPYFDAASGYLLETDKHGNILLGGVFADSLFCETENLISKGHNDIFIARLHADGHLDKMKHIGSKGKERLTALSADSLGHIYLAGNHEKDLLCDNIEMKSTHKDLAGNGFLMQLDSTLTTQWCKPVTSTSYTEITGLSCDMENHVLMSGNYNHILKVDTLLYPTHGLTDFFVCKADTLGTVKWLKSFGGKYVDRSNDIKLNQLGGVMVTGSFNDTVYMDSLQIATLSYYSEAFITQLNALGEVTWAESIQGEGGSSSQGATLDSNGNLYMMGSFNGTMSAGESELESQGDEDIFVAKYYNCPPVLNAIDHPAYLCQGSEVSLSVAHEYRNIIWNDTLKDVNQVLISEPGSYHVWMVDKKGCVLTDTVDIREIPEQKFSLGNDTSLLVYEQLEINGPSNAFAYQWQDGSNLQSLMAYCSDEKPGFNNYELTITDTLGCQWSSDITIEFYTEPEYADLSQGERLVTLFPNPVKESFTWYLETYKEVRMNIEILDGAGQVFHHQEIGRYQPGQSMKMQVSDLSPGIYYFSVISNDKRITKKFVKE